MKKMDFFDDISFEDSFEVSAPSSVVLDEDTSINPSDSISQIVDSKKRKTRLTSEIHEHSTDIEAVEKGVKVMRKKCKYCSSIFKCDKSTSGNFFNFHLLLLTN
jgi:hypothetical protein